MLKTKTFKEQLCIRCVLDIADCDTCQVVHKCFALSAVLCSIMYHAIEPLPVMRKQCSALLSLSVNVSFVTCPPPNNNNPEQPFNSFPDAALLHTHTHTHTCTLCLHQTSPGSFLNSVQCLYVLLYTKLPLVVVAISTGVNALYWYKQYHLKVNVEVYSLVSSAKRYSPDFTQLPPSHRTCPFISHLNSPGSIQPFSTRHTGSTSLYIYQQLPQCHTFPCHTRYTHKFSTFRNCDLAAYWQYITWKCQQVSDLKMLVLNLLHTDCHTVTAIFPYLLQILPICSTFWFQLQVQF